MEQELTKALRKALAATVSLADAVTSAWNKDEALCALHLKEAQELVKEARQTLTKVS